MLFQVGDFFEMYGEDAKQAAELLDLNLTTRAIPGAGRVAMCGVPAHNLENYVEELRGKYDVTIAAAPERPLFVEKFREEIPRYMIKHQVRPGMTGWAQINGYRGNTSIRRRIDYDLYYIENWSVGLDIKILFLTIFKGFINKNAY